MMMQQFLDESLKQYQELKVTFICMCILKKKRSDAHIELNAEYDDATRSWRKAQAVPGATIYFNIYICKFVLISGAHILDLKIVIHSTHKIPINKLLPSIVIVELSQQHCVYAFSLIKWNIHIYLNSHV